MTSGPILIVDDDLDIREALADTLEHRGFDVVAAANGRDAIELIRSMPLPPSAVLLDLMMPVMDGYGFLEERRKDPALRAIPVAIITAGHGVDRSRLDDARIVPKPIDLARLMGVLHGFGTAAGSLA
jgi:CheY-like chemotaxis protein